MEISELTEEQKDSIHLSFLYALEGYESLGGEPVEPQWGPDVENRDELHQIDKEMWAYMETHPGCLDGISLIEVDDRYLSNVDYLTFARYGCLAIIHRGEVTREQISERKVSLLSSLEQFELPEDGLSEKERAEWEETQRALVQSLADDLDPDIIADQINSEYEMAKRTLPIVEALLEASGGSGG